MITIRGFQKILPYMSLFWQGMLCTVALSAFTVIFGFLLALLLSLMRMSRVKVLKAISATYVEVIRATPMMVQLFLVYYVIMAPVSLPTWKLFGFIRFERFIPGVVALSLNSGAYLSEIIRSGIQSIDVGQTEAARSLGLTQAQNMRFVVLPQAIKNILPAIANEFVTIIKESSIVSVIGIADLMYRAKGVIAKTYNSLECLAIAAIMYFILTFIGGRLIALMERKMAHGRK